MQATIRRVVTVGSAVLVLGFLGRYSAVRLAEEDSTPTDASLSAEDRFTQAGLDYCQRHEYPYCDLFGPAVWQQLFLEVRASPAYTSPEVRGASGFDTLEASRGLRRVNRFLALFDTNERSAYQLFTAGQGADERLPLAEFKVLCSSAQSLALDEREVLFAAALMKPSKAALDDYAADGIMLPQDSEETLTAVAKLAAEGKSHMPIVDAMTMAERTLLPMAHPADVHVRHVLLGEAGLRRIVMAAESLKAGKQVQNLTYWRWLIDLCGFTAQGVTKSLKCRFDRVFMDLCAVADGVLAPEMLMVRYLQQLPESMGVSEIVRRAELSDDESLLVARLLSFFTTMDAVTANGIVEGYLAYREKYPDSDLVSHYKAFLGDCSAKAPTYTPAVLKTAMSEFARLGDAAAVSHATDYTLTLLETVHGYMMEHPEQRVACRNAAWFKNMRGKGWAQAFLDGRGVGFAVQDTSQGANKSAEVETHICTADEPQCGRL